MKEKLEWQCGDSLQGAWTTVYAKWYFEYGLAPASYERSHSKL